MDAHRPGVEQVARAIQAHLDQHPLAADSAAGVARWWLGGEACGVSTEQVEQALEWMVARQTLRRLSLLDGTRLYSQSPRTRQ